MVPSTRPLGPSDRPTLASEPSTEASLESDHEIDGRYRIETLLGVGAMGAVYRARHVKVGRPVAIKVLAPEWAAHATMPERFREEARAASAIGHPGIVGILDAGSLPDGRPYLVMELLQGRPLAKVFGEQAPLEPSRACTILAQIARAIAAAHDAGIVHRDLKPDNVMLCTAPEGEHAKVLDFGIAHAVAPLRARLTIPGTVMGTPEYMAPEQVRGDAAAPAFDIYALGVIGFEALSGRVPIDGTTSVEIMAKKSLDPSPSLSGARPDLPGDLVELIDACLAREPADRPANARIVADALDRVQRRLSVGGVASPARSGARSGWMLASVGAAALAATLAWITSERPEALREASPGAVTEPERTEPDVSPPTLIPPPERVADALEAVVDDVPSIAGPPIAQAEPDPASPRRQAATKPTRQTSSCAETRRQAEVARRDQKWTHLLKWLDARVCFPAAERTRLRTKAYMELGQFERCASVGRGSADAQVKRMVELCEHRRG